MKTLTYPTNKWVLTATLLAVLGLNVSFNLHKDGVATADFASTEGAGVTQGKIYTADGVVPVKYIDNGEDKVLAIVPKKMTEGKVCDSCGFNSIPLNVKNKTDIDALNVALMKAMATKLTESTAKPEEKNESETSPLDAVQAACEKLSSEERVLSCLTDKFIKTIKDKKKAEHISAGDALAFYKDEIQSRLLAKASRAQSDMRRSLQMSLGRDSSFSLHSSEDLFEEADGAVEEVAQTIRNMIRDVPSKYESVRKALVDANSSLLKYEAAQYKNALNRELTTKDPYEYPHLRALRMKQGAVLNRAYDSLNSNVVLGIQGAYDKGYITREQSNLYQRYINDFNTSLMNALSSNNSNNTLLDNVIIIPGADLTARIAAPGRGVGVIQTPGRTLSAPATTNSVLVPQDQVIQIVPQSNVLDQRIRGRQ